MTITITGASGFLGINLSKYLEEKGNTVAKLSLRNPDFALPKDADAVIHLAGKAHDTANTSAAKEYFEINTELTKTIFNQFLRSAAKDFIFFSSVKAAADSVTGVLTEDRQSTPETPYGKSKLAAEEFLLAQRLPAGKRLIILRPCMIHGPGNKGNLNLLYQVVQKRIPWPLAAYENRRSYLGIDNLNFLIDKILQSAIPSGIYNLADDQSISTNELIKIIGDVTGRPARLIPVAPRMIEAAAAAGDRFRLPLNSERLKKLTENYEVSNAKIKAHLKIKDLPLSVQQGLRITIESFRERHNDPFF